mgnify:CR=1 FL=1|tara:strand:- start:1336 stop:2388 length:1053 start_codon:yes stop_codon:yes gene_type:complete
MKKFIILLTFFLMTLLSLSTKAHHSFGSTFDESREIVLEGYVSRVRYTNPHVILYFLVTNDNGVEEEWYMETGSPISVRRINFNRDTFSEGDYIRVTGNPSRNGTNMVGSQNPEANLKFVDPVSGEITGGLGGEAQDNSVYGMSLQLSNVIPNLSGFWTGNARASETGRVGAPRRNVPFHDLNEEAARLQSLFDPMDDPQVWCEPPGLVRQAGFGPHPLHIEQYDDRVIISYEEYAGRRVIYLDQREMIGGEHTHLGQSWARYEDQKLIIESSHLLPNLASNIGYLLSDQTTTVETYSRNDLDDGKAVLMMEMLVTDPVNLLTPVYWARGRFGASSYQFTPVNCVKPLTN